jgi:hypothetical protein
MSPGLPLERQQYLYKHINEFVDDPYIYIKDTMCHQPAVLPSSASDDEAVNEPQPLPSTSESAPRVRGRRRAKPSSNRSRSPHRHLLQLYYIV